MRHEKELLKRVAEKAMAEERAERERDESVSYRNSPHSIESLNRDNAKMIKINHISTIQKSRCRCVNF